ncbi:alpha/beta fold hydrolase [Amycolatopsis sp. OK19-0408]|uniref:Alpha/beta fold hydrolase n=1 Tax=Amycolatopsis iheyensis TaxID=2945988 RepID=A0A9X2NLL4_9PSEU|nr:alpha/beta fold hydrolase [Amycolatopsis iheyensis]MCR6488779.1 alpha/beta fold hydrolase [Amycolatopsis iheyensis]
MSESSALFRTWLRRFRPADDAATALVCLPHAGGSASFYFPLARALAPAIDVLAVQYPGRQDRRHEPNIDSLGELADRVADAVALLDGQPVVLFGHSMGALLAYEVALRMGDAGPAHLFASGRRAPSRYRDDRFHLMSDRDVLAHVRRLGGPGSELLDDPEIQSMVLPLFRNDYRAVETYRHDPVAVLDCPVTVLNGDRDTLVSSEEAQAWAGHTRGPSDIVVLPGGHFYLADHTERIAQLLRGRLSVPSLP